MTETIQQKGGKAIVAKKGREYMSELGKKSAAKQKKEGWNFHKNRTDNARKGFATKKK